MTITSLVLKPVHAVYDENTGLQVQIKRGIIVQYKSPDLPHGYIRLTPDLIEYIGDEK